MTVHIDRLAVLQLIASPSQTQLDAAMPSATVTVGTAPNDHSWTIFGARRGLEQADSRVGTFTYVQQAIADQRAVGRGASSIGRKNGWLVLQIRGPVSELDDAIDAIIDDLYQGDRIVFEHHTGGPLAVDVVNAARIKGINPDTDTPLDQVIFTIEFNAPAGAIH